MTVKTLLLEDKWVTYLLLDITSMIIQTLIESNGLVSIIYLTVLRIRYFLLYLLTKIQVFLLELPFTVNLKIKKT